MHIPELIQDLALMLLVAGAITLIFKRLKQPLVLGYIVTGFLVGPYFGLFPTITDATSIETWSEIGIIILMFALGLEFNLLKLFSVGKTAVITAVTELAFMFLLGYMTGMAFGWNTISSVFLGCMLSMSSTTIIIKAFEDLKLKGEPFTKVVFGTLIIEDIAGILMMVIFSTMAGSQGGSGGEMTMSLIKMGFYLALWLILGILLIPTFIKKTAHLMSDETLMIVSIGICFGMVLLSTYLGFSSALGAFLAGSLLAGTELSERIERVTKANKDLFGAVFFISVGMMVDPSKIVSNIGIIIVLTLLTIVGKSIFSALGVFISGKPLHTSILCGFSLAQIGEFSFIIASLGISLGLIDSGIYPIIVSVSVITTFTTPFVIKSSEKAYGLLNRILPEELMEKLDRKNTKKAKQREPEKSTWKKFLESYLLRLMIQVVLLLGIIIGGIHLLWPLLKTVMNAELASILSILVVIVFSAPFLKQTAVQRNRHFINLWFREQKDHWKLLLFALASLLLMICMIVYPVQKILGINGLLLAAITYVIVSVITYSDWLVGLYQRLERLFIRNLGAESSELDYKQPRPPLKLVEKEALPVEFKVAKFYYDQVMPVSGEKLCEVIKTADAGVKVIRLDRGGRIVTLPDKGRHLFDGDTVYILGLEEQLDAFFDKTDQSPDKDDITGETYIPLSAFIDSYNEIRRRRNLGYRKLEVTEDSLLSGMKVNGSRFRNKHRDMLLLMQRGDEDPVTNPDDDWKFESGDKIWVIGKNKPEIAKKNRALRMLW